MNNKLTNKFEKKIILDYPLGILDYPHCTMRFRQWRIGIRVFGAFFGLLDILGTEHYKGMWIAVRHSYTYSNIHHSAYYGYVPNPAPKYVTVSYNDRSRDVVKNPYCWFNLVKMDSYAFICIRKNSDNMSEEWNTFNSSFEYKLTGILPSFEQKSRYSIVFT